MSTSASITLDPAFVVGPVRRRTFGAFIEHLGRCVYTGIHDPGHPTADADGFRQDVIDLVKELGVGTVRYPGGNFVSGYRWEDGIGPVDQRPTRLDLAWHSADPNTVGVDEFMRWCAKADIEPMMAINLGTRGVQEALDILEYTNVAGGSHYSDLRRAHGREEPYGIRMWCLGNEMDGPWQIGHKTAEEYARLAHETANAMRMIDKDLELVVCGSSNSHMPTFGSWEATVLAETYEQVDLISAHAYYEEVDGDLASFLASAVNMDHFIESVVATADYVRAVGKHSKRINISFDEWNVWYKGRGNEEIAPQDWPVAPRLLENQYNVADAVVVGSLLISLLRHTDRVHSASLAQLVNVIAPIMTEPGGRVWKQTTFHPFSLTAKHAQGEVLRVALSSPTHHTEQYGEVTSVDAVATRDPQTGAVALFAVNRNPDAAVDVSVALEALGDLGLVEALTYSHDDHTWSATADDDTTVLPAANDSAALADGQLSLTLPPTSWSVVRLS